MHVVEKRWVRTNKVEFEVELCIIIIVTTQIDTYIHAI